MVEPRRVNTADPEMTTATDERMADPAGATAPDEATGYGISEPPLYRGLSEAFLAALETLAMQPEGGWWRDVLAHPNLILAVRREALDVYHRGASLFRVRFVRGRVVADTHAKYLVRQAQTRVALAEDGAFALAGKTLLWSGYAGPETLAEMIKAAGSLVGVEKTGVHALCKASPNVVDVEIALAGDDPGDLEGPASQSEATVDTAVGADPDASSSAEPGAAHRVPRQDRIDVASLEERGHPGEAWLVFHEAKDFSNGALRASPKRTPAIVAQMGRYRGSVGQNASALRYSYPFVCRALVRLDRLRRRVRADDPDWADRPRRALDPVIADVADGTRRLQVEVAPRLVVFGYDGAQKPVCEAECERLRTQFGLRHVYAVGDPAGSKVAAAFRRPADVPLTPPPAPAAPPPERIPLPTGAPSGLCLHFAGSGSSRPVYLCNPGETALTAVRVESVGVTANHPEVVHTGTATLTLPEAPARGGVLIDTYDAMTDGDRLTPYAISATRADGTRLRARAIVGKGGPSGRFLALDITDEPAATIEPAAPPTAAS